MSCVCAPGASSGTCSAAGAFFPCEAGTPTCGPFPCTITRLLPSATFASCTAARRMLSCCACALAASPRLSSAFAPSATTIRIRKLRYSFRGGDESTDRYQCFGLRNLCNIREFAHALEGFMQRLRHKLARLRNGLRRLAGDVRFLHGGLDLAHRSDQKLHLLADQNLHAVMRLLAGCRERVDIVMLCCDHRRHIDAWDIDSGEQFGEIGKRIGRYNHGEAPSCAALSI